MILLALVAGACGGSTSGGSHAPRPISVVPAAGYSTAPTSVEIDGSGFLVKATRRSDGGDPTVDRRHRAWLGDAELSDVTWVSSTRLTATVPVGLPLGTFELTVENAMGERGSLDAAFSVLAAPSLAAMVAMSRASVNVGQPFTFTLAVTNRGGTDIAGFSLGEPVLSSDEGATATLDGPAPSAPATVAAGESLSFTWTCRAGDTPGALAISVTASGKDPVSGETLYATPPAAAHAAVQRPASLGTATAWSASPTRANVGQPIAVTLTVASGAGSAAAILASLTPSVNPAADASCTAVSPVPSSVSIAGGGSATFTWACTATAPGSYTLGAALTASDANTGESVPGPSLPGIPVNFVGATQTLVVMASPGGAGTFSCTVDGAAHDCGSAPTGSSVSVSATAARNYAFSSWSGPCAGASANPCTFTMPPAAVTLTGNFVFRIIW